MKDHRAKGHREAEAWLSGAPGSQTPTDGVGAFFEALDRSVPVESPSREDAHIAAMMAAVATTQTETVAATGWFNRLGFRFRVMLASLSAFGAVGGMAAAGVLPDPVQRAVANAAKRIGIEIPGGDEDRREPKRAPSLVPEDRDGSREVKGSDEDADEEAREAREERLDKAEDRADDRRDEREDNKDEADDREDDRRDRDDDAREEEEDRKEDEREEEEEREESREDRLEDRDEPDAPDEDSDDEND